MIESEDASSVAATLAKNLMGVAKNKSSFEKLPDNFWGYYARGHDSKGEFGIFVTHKKDQWSQKTVNHATSRWSHN